MSLEIILTILWGIGWFATLALAAAATFANWEAINNGDEDGGFNALMIALPASAVLALLWPIAMAVMVGWYLYPAMARAIAERNAPLRP